MFWTKSGDWHVLHAFDDDGDEIILAMISDSDFVKTNEVFKEMAINEIKRLASNFNIKEES